MKTAFVNIHVSSKDPLSKYGHVHWLESCLPAAPLLGLEVSEANRRIIHESVTGWERVNFEVLMHEALSLFRQGQIGALLFPRVDRETRFIFASFPLLSGSSTSMLTRVFCPRKTAT